MRRFTNANSSHQLVMEKTPRIMVSPNSIDRLRAFNRKMRLIFALRDPFVRAVSDYVHQMEQASARGAEKWGREATFQEVRVQEQHDR